MKINITGKWVRRKRGLKRKKTPQCHRLGVTTHFQMVWMKPRIWTVIPLNFPCNFTLLHMSPLCQGSTTVSRLIILLCFLMLSFPHYFGPPSNSTALSWQDLHSVTRNCSPFRLHAKTVCHPQMRCSFCAKSVCEISLCGEQILTSKKNTEEMNDQILFKSIRH